MFARLAATLGKPAVLLAIAPAARVYEVGQPIGVRVTAVGVRDSSVLRARAELAQTMWPRGPSGDPSPDFRTVTRTGSELGLAGRSLPAGARADCEAVLPNWAQAPSGGRGVKIEYRVRAELRLAGGSTVRGEAPVHLVSGPSLYREVEGTQRRRRCRRCELELVEPVLRARPGETVRGALRLVPHQPTRILSIRLYVVRWSSAPREAGRKIFRGGYLAHEVGLGGPREFPFEVRLQPKMPPTMIDPPLFVRWYLRAEVRYGLIAQDSCNWELNIYTSPP